MDEPAVATLRRRGIGIPRTGGAPWSRRGRSGPRPTWTRPGQRGPRVRLLPRRFAQLRLGSAVRRGGHPGGTRRRPGGAGEPGLPGSGGALRVRPRRRPVPRSRFGDPDRRQRARGGPGGEPAQPGGLRRPRPDRHRAQPGPAGRRPVGDRDPGRRAPAGSGAGRRGGHRSARSRPPDRDADGLAAALHGRRGPAGRHRQGVPPGGRAGKWSRAQPRPTRLLDVGLPGRPGLPGGTVRRARSTCGRTPRSAVSSPG